MEVFYSTIKFIIVIIGTQFIYVINRTLFFSRNDVSSEDWYENLAQRFVKKVLTWLFIFIILMLIMFNDLIINKITTAYDANVALQNNISQARNLNAVNSKQSQEKVYNESTFEKELEGLK
ncbi:MAG: hypothetical protein QX191_01900 [Methylococcaceae bacterium]